MQFPMFTGASARFLKTTEPKLSETVRRGKVHPRPRILAGRRLWERDQLLQAAEHLGLLTDELRRELGLEVGHVQ